jgi:hypothetical protein
MQHRTRDLLMRQRTQRINALRAHPAELRIVAAQGREGIQDLLTIVADNEDLRGPIDARAISTRTGVARTRSEFTLLADPCDTAITVASA